MLHLYSEYAKKRKQNISNYFKILSAIAPKLMKGKVIGVKNTQVLEHIQLLMQKINKNEI